MYRCGLPAPVWCVTLLSLAFANPCPDFCFCLFLPHPPPPTTPCSFGRDLKAENVLMLPDGTWVVCDFGSATSRAQLYETPAEIAAEEEVISKHTIPAYRPLEVRQPRGVAAGPVHCAWVNVRLQSHGTGLLLSGTLFGLCVRWVDCSDDQLFAS